VVNSDRYTEAAMNKSGKDTDGKVDNPTEAGGTGEDDCRWFQEQTRDPQRSVVQKTVGEPAKPEPPGVVDTGGPQANTPPQASRGAARWKYQNQAEVHEQASQSSSYFAGRDGIVIYLDAMDAENYVVLRNGRASKIPREVARARYACRDLDKISFATPPTRFLSSKGGTAATDKILDKLLKVVSPPPTISQAEVRAVVRSYMYSHGLRSELPVRPMILAYGPPGAGKTVVLRLLGTLLYGPGFEVTPCFQRASDLPAIMKSTPFLVVDNVEDAPGWMIDALSLVATGVEFSTRKLYTTSDLARVKPDIFVAVTGIDMSWLRGDLLDRAIPLHFTGPAPGIRIADKELRDMVEKVRPHFLGEMFRTLAEAFQQYLTARRLVSDDRLLDFEHIGALIAEAAGGAIERKRFLDGFAAMRRFRADAIASGSPEMGALLSLLASGPVQHTPLGWADAIAKELGAKNKVKSVWDAKKAVQWMTALKRQSSGLVKWEQGVRPHGKPRPWCATPILGGPKKP
jgi:hypothetical protein